MSRAKRRSASIDDDDSARRVRPTSQIDRRLGHPIGPRHAFADADHCLHDAHGLLLQIVRGDAGKKALVRAW